MDFHLIGELVRLRYKLMWARTRTRNGKIAWFMAGYLLLTLAVILFAAGGLGAGGAAVKSGKAEVIAQGVLTGLFLSALSTSVMLGFGVNAAFTDLELRRFPLKARERSFARHFTGVADPFWFLFVALYLGLATGLYLFGASNLLLGAAAVLLLLVCNYLAAQVAGLLLERALARKGGAIILPLIFMAVFFVPQLIVPQLKKNPAAFASILKALAYAPTFGAGSLMTRTDAGAAYGLAVLVSWILALVAVLVVLERRAPKRQVERQTAGGIRWETVQQRVGGLFGSQLGPMVAHWLEFYFRCRRFRISFLISVPLIPFLLFVWTQQGPRSDPLAGALGVFAAAGIAPAAALIVNQFGYVGGGFRRYFLFPIDPGATLRASSYALITVSSALIIFTTAAWLLFARAPVTPQSLAMLVSGAVFGLFSFQGLGLWTSLYSPRRCDPNQTMGNDLSGGGNVVVIGSMMLFLIGPRTVGTMWKGAIVPERWWIVAALALLAVGFYHASLRRASAVLPSRRERLLAVLEGKA